MPADRELTRVHIWMDKEDIEEIDRLYGDTLGRSKAIRLFVKKYLAIIKAEVEAKSRVPEVSHDLQL